MIPFLFQPQTRNISFSKKGKNMSKTAVGVMNVCAGRSGQKVEMWCRVPIHGKQPLMSCQDCCGHPLCDSALLIIVSS